MENAKCVIVVPFGASIEYDCELSLRRLEERGYKVWRVAGCVAIDRSRSQLATAALNEGFEEIMWIDSDVGFEPDDVDRLRKHDLPLVSGVYPKKGLRGVSCRVLPGTKSLRFGAEGGLTKIQYAAGGFLLTKRQVYMTIATQLKLPICNERAGRAFVPYFLPLIVADGASGHMYLGEDFAFSERARTVGIEIIADTRIRLRHIGRYSYSYEDAGTSLQRFATYQLNLGQPD